MKMHKQIGRMNGKKQRVNRENNHKELGFDLSKYKVPNKSTLLNNCVFPDIGKAILDTAMNIYDSSKNNQIGLFQNVIN